jgi:hypothetical protein
VSLSPSERATSGVLERCLEELAVQQKIQCPSIIVRREVYEHLGGFLSDLCYALDWELWVRIAARYPIWYEPNPLACYRLHKGNETARLSRTGTDLVDWKKSIEIVSQHVPTDARHAVRKKAHEVLATRIDTCAFPYID